PGRPVAADDLCRRLPPPVGPGPAGPRRPAARPGPPVHLLPPRRPGAADSGPVECPRLRPRHREGTEYARRDQGRGAPADGLAPRRQGPPPRVRGREGAGGVGRPHGPAPRTAPAPHLPLAGREPLPPPRRPHPPAGRVAADAPG